MRRFAILLPAAALALLAPVAAVAQEASPAATAAACEAEPRLAAEVVDLFFARAAGAAATPAADPMADAAAGEPADPETVAAIDAALRTFVTCLSAGQNLRGLSVLTDDAVGRAGPDLSGIDEATAAEVRGLLETQIAATPSADQAATLQSPAIEGPREARLLGTDRAVGIWRVGDGEVAAVFLRQTDGRWLLDAIAPVAPAAAATPSADAGG